MLDNVENYFVEFGFSLAHRTKKKARFEKDGFYPMYLDLTSLEKGRHEVILHPESDHLLDDNWGAQGFPDTRDSYYHSSNMTVFPKRIHKGANPIGYGYKLSSDTKSRMLSMLKKIKTI